MITGKQIFVHLKLWDVDACATNDALYLELGNGTYVKLTPTQVTRDEYDKAWDEASGVKG